MTIYYTQRTNFYKGNSPEQLLKNFGSPLYVYNEDIFRERCRQMVGLVDYPHYKVTYSIKANSNLTLLKIAREEGMHADAMSPGEIYVLEKAGFKPCEIFYISNNVSEEEMKFAIDRGIDTSVDSLSQLEMFGRLNPGGKVAIRINPGIGAGHHAKVITGGKKTKFGINTEYLDQVKAILKKYNLTLKGINQHIGSLFMDGSKYLESVKNTLEIAKQFDTIEFVDFGGGFGIPYRKQEGQAPLELKEFGQRLGDVLKEWVKEYGREILFRSEPGRYIVAESSVLLGTVHAIKENGETFYVGTDIGFNVLARPIMYDAHHELELYRNGKLVTEGETITADVVGNICESGDILAKERTIFMPQEKDIIGVMDAGAYGYSMSSNYNNRLRPAEVLIRSDGSVQLIRRRDTLEDLIRNF
ncbi:MAG: diaminopimelate decarboxylase [Clostridia bacterium]|jgi:diaminopimelate decarboxylase|nr:diaminopimelate decarboxylase [Clostridiaceae bacterium]